MSDPQKKYISQSSEEFDFELKNIEDLKWLPWVGKDYSTLKCNKLLIVGESHYHTSKENSQNINDTRWMIHSAGYYFNNQPGSSHHRFLRTTEKVLWSKRLVTKENRQTLWRSVCFYNLVQRKMDTVKKRPTNEDFITGIQTFTNVINILKPDNVIFCGVTAFSKHYKLQEVLVEAGYALDILDADKQTIDRIKVRETYKITKDGHTTLISCFKHPSVGCTYWSWAKRLKKQMPNYFTWLRSQKDSLMPRSNN